MWNKNTVPELREALTGLSTNTVGLLLPYPTNGVRRLVASLRVDQHFNTDLAAVNSLISPMVGYL